MEEYKLPALPYAYNALEPYIDEQTMKVHHDKHHQTYVDKFNAALASVPEFRAKVKSAEEILKDLSGVPESIRGAVRNHGGGSVNHTFFWSSMTGERQSPSGKIAEALSKKFGSVDKFKEAFNASAAGIFGSGWCWLVLNKGELEIMTTPNQDSPLSQGKVPLLTLDVWEHAYYLKYQNKRPDYVSAWWNVVNWNEVEKRFNHAKK
ncbi:MAG: superoxide dismutase [Candidatus Micrarchaeota archaeon]|nr:superoxide dismutase [Candidatus Micrarchaeota archaeon]